MHRGNPPMAKAVQALLLAAALAAPLASQAAISSVTLAATQAEYAGDCPAKAIFNGAITVTAPTTVTYVFTRSDGATDSVTKTLIFSAAGSKPVSTSWTLGGPSLPQFSGWQAVKILTPVVMESPRANFKVSCDPPFGSAKAAHGNTDWHIDTANEFLFGKDMGGVSTAANFAPASWNKKHIHVGLTNTAAFYSDKARVATGTDEDLTNGIDKPMLFFYAGHGNATVWNTLGNNGTQSSTLLGNITGKGQLRYYWQCSCEVFAHGPRICAGSDCDYSEPENFDGSADSFAMRNVFERWGPALGKDLRMACGVSTLAYCHESNVNKIWNNYNNNGLSVADSFIDGLGSASVKPLCITRGGTDIGKTPLFDEAFTNRRNSSGDTHLHILYAGGTQTEPPVLIWKPWLIPLQLYTIDLFPAPDPEPFRKLLIVSNGTEQIRSEQLQGGAAIVTRHAESGALHLKALGRSTSTVPTVGVDARRIALNFAEQLGWLDNSVGAISSKKLLTSSMPIRGTTADIRNGEKGTLVTVHRRLANGRQLVDSEGPGGRIDIIVDPAGRISRASRTWRQTTVGSTAVAIKTFEQAQAEAQRSLLDGAGYRLAEWRFVYREDSPNVKQARLQPLFTFDYVAIDKARQLTLPPQHIEVSANVQ